MKALWAAVGTVWFAGWTICSYRVFASSRPLPVLVESESPSPPPAPSRQPAGPTSPRRTFTPEQLFSGPPTRPAAPRERTRTSPRSIPPPLIPRPALSPPPPSPVSIPDPGRLPPSPEPGSDAALCLLCKEPAYSWVERDGQRYGYCLTHQQPSGGETGVKARTKEDRPQCLGTTKAGTRCRRKASDAGYCYQHKPF